MEAIYHVEGRCTPNGTAFYYEYTIKDHLGNARVNFRANGTAATHLEEMHYYPFGSKPPTTPIYPPLIGSGLGLPKRRQ